MPRVDLVAYRELDGSVPLLEWLERLPAGARAKCVARLGRLAVQGHELRRPEADYLRNDVYELRAKHQRVNLRMLYFFHSRTAIVVSHGLSKQQARVPNREIEQAIRRKQAFETSPSEHTHEGEVESS